MDDLELARLRRDYELVGLDETMLPADPLELFHAWLADAVRATLAEANAMVVSTVAGDGSPSSRLVLCKGADQRGFVFFTNYGSRKGRDIEADPHVSLLFPWHPLGRQVRVDGTAARTDPAESAAYFDSRPRGAQLSALASAQSDVVATRAELEQRVVELDRRYAGSDVPRPPHWGGIRVQPQAIEFWQGRRDRLHDRLRYRRGAAVAGSAWMVERLQP
ncbi:MAG: pyridoxamine 5-phosphate oxidase [Frankiaceae bacterium]|jgi:pyridoxamine 5'-phosphate oxidase|nr:pyridoxamine 5-phosphate oxidase [Frankiaceae bacterium]